MSVATLRIDLAKHVFHLYGEDAHGKAVLRKRLSRTALKPFLATLPPCRVGMEACGERTSGRGSFSSWGMRCTSSILRRITLQCRE